MMGMPTRIDKRLKQYRLPVTKGTVSQPLSVI